jgi:hypothetical protein
VRYSDSLLGDDRELRLAWDWADGPNPDAKLVALLHLAKDLSKLPSPVFFEVPEGGEADDGWVKLIAASKPHCKCPSRRIMWPTQGRSRLLTRESDGKNIKTITFDPLVHAMRGYSAPPILIAPHGGDMASAFAMFTMRRSVIGWQRWLMDDDLRVGERQIWSQGSNPDDYIGHAPTNAWFMMLSSGVATLKREGEILLFQRIPDPLGRNAHAAVPLCSVVAVNHAEPGSDELSSYTLEVDGGMRTFTNLTDEDLRPHRCVPA